MSKSEPLGPKRVNLPDNIEYTAWAPFLEANVVHKRPIEDPEVQKLYQDTIASGLDWPLRPLPSPKWPATHSERIEYLKNIQAVIEWHETFPPDEMCSDALVYF